MKFPITRETLQAFDQKKEDAEKQEEIIQWMLEADTKAICTEVVRGMSNYSREKKFVWRDLNNVQRPSISVRSGPSISVRSGIGPSQITKDIYLPRIIEKLKETFIGCDVISDPLKTYIIIDWS